MADVSQTVSFDLSDFPVGPADIHAAAATIRGAVVETPCSYSRTLSNICGCEVWLKFENLQFTSSFKERGALNRLTALTPEERARGVVAMSAGNHAQGVAYHARRLLGIPATIVMPVGTPMVKVENTRHHGAEVVVTGATLEEAAAFARSHGEARGMIFVHPYDDPLVIAGQGTVGLEMLKAVPELDTLLVPIGGGGLISGIAIAAKSLKPSLRIVGVEAWLYPSMYNAIHGGTLPDARRYAGRRHRGQIARQDHHRDRSPAGRRHFTRQRSRARARVATLISIEKTVVEGAGAAGLAAVMSDPSRFAGEKVGLVLSGGNIDTRLIASVLTRELAREGRLTQLSLDIPDRPGQLAAVAALLAEAGANIIEVSHQRTFSDLPAKATLLQLVIETRDSAHLDEVMARLSASGLSARCA